MNPLLIAAFRRHWRVAGALLAFAIFTVIHLAFFRPASERYRRALASVGGIEAVFNPGGSRPMLPPRVFALIADNSLSSQDALERGGSGALGVILLEELGRVAEQAGVRIASSEPGAVTQEPLTTQVRAHLVLRGRYADLVGFFDGISRSESLVLVERFSIKPLEDGSDVMELWVSRLYLKQPGTTP